MMELKKVDWVLYILLAIKKVLEKKKNSELSDSTTLDLTLKKKS